MALQLSDTARNALLDALETAVGASAVLKIRTGAPPANCAASDVGTVLATLNLPADWMAAAASGQKVLQGSWLDTSADANGTAGHFRVYASDGVTCHMQGTCSAAGGGGDLLMESVVVTAGTPVPITQFTLIAGNG